MIREKQVTPPGTRTRAESSGPFPLSLRAKRISVGAGAGCSRYKLPPILSLARPGDDRVDRRPRRKLSRPRPVSSSPAGEPFSWGITPTSDGASSLRSGAPLPDQEDAHPAAPRPPAAHRAQDGGSLVESVRGERRIMADTCGQAARLFSPRPAGWIVMMVFGTIAAMLRYLTLADETSRIMTLSSPHYSEILMVPRCNYR